MIEAYATGFPIRIATYTNRDPVGFTRPWANASGKPVGSQASAVIRELGLAPGRTNPNFERVREPVLETNQRVFLSHPPGGAPLDGAVGGAGSLRDFGRRRLPACRVA